MLGSFCYVVLILAPPFVFILAIDNALEQIVDSIINFLLRSRFSSLPRLYFNIIVSVCTQFPSIRVSTQIDRVSSAATLNDYLFVPRVPTCSSSSEQPDHVSCHSCFLRFFQFFDLRSTKNNRSVCEK